MTRVRGRWRFGPPVNRTENLAKSRISKSEMILEKETYAYEEILLVFPWADSDASFASNKTNLEEAFEALMTAFNSLPTLASGGSMNSKSNDPSTTTPFLSVSDCSTAVKYRLYCSRNLWFCVLRCSFQTRLGSTTWQRSQAVAVAVEIAGWGATSIGGTPASSAFRWWTRPRICCSHPLWLATFALQIEQ